MKCVRGVSVERASPDAALPRPVNADALDAAPLAARRIPPGRAALEHAQVTEREVVFDGVARVVAPERERDLLGRLPGDVLAPREPEVPPELVDVRVDGDEQ